MGKQNILHITPGYRSGKLIVIALDHIKHYSKYWQCQCECGNTKVIKGSSLTRKNATQSCGCLVMEMLHSRKGTRPQTRPGWQVTAYRVFTKRYNDGDLTFEDFLLLSQQPCYYCGTIKSNRFNPYMRLDGQNRCKQTVSDERKIEMWWEYNGLDRIDSALPHYKENCVPCCKKCNLMKQAMHTKEFLHQCLKIIHYQQNKK